MILDAVGVQAVASATTGPQFTSFFFNLIAMVMSVVLPLIAFMAYRLDKKKDLTDEGRRLQQLSDLDKALIEARADIRNLESRINNTDVGMGEIKTDIKHIMDALTRIEGKLERGGQ